MWQDYCFLEGMQKKLPNLKNLLLITVFLVADLMYAQDYSRVDNRVKAYPTSFASPEKLAETINKDFASETDKVRAIFTWIATNVKYDLAAYNTIRNGSGGIAYSYSSEKEKQQKELEFRLDLAKRTLKTKKGVCQHYSALFHTLCDLTGIKCMDVPGTSKTSLVHIGKLPVSSDHIWNVVRIADKWQFIDVTWASGSVDGKTGKFVSRFNDGYFFTTPEVFFLNHFPDDKRMLMVEKTAEDFASLPLYYGEYIRSGYEFAAPQNGILSASGSTVTFSIKKLPADATVAYVFSSESLLRPMAVIQKGEISEFAIPLTSKSRGYLTLFINNKSIASYKIAR